VIDLDVTLIHKDMLHESALRALNDNPPYALKTPSWLGKCKAYLKQKIESHCNFDDSSLPFNEELPPCFISRISVGATTILTQGASKSGKKVGRIESKSLK